MALDNPTGDMDHITPESVRLRDRIGLSELSRKN